MCGICGFIDISGETRDPLKVVSAMCDVIIHRGPDEEGCFVEGGAALGMRRLKIIDLATGSQPIFNGVDTGRFAPASRDRGLRETPGLDEGGIVIGSVGRLNPVKNYPLLLKAFSAIGKGHNIRLILAGEGEAEEELRSLAESLGISSQTVFLGRRPMSLKFWEQWIFSCFHRSARACQTLFSKP